MNNVILTQITDPADSRLGLVHSLYIESFPEAERRPWDSMINLIASGMPFFSLYIASTPEAPFAGFITVWKLPRATYIEHLAVNTTLRSQGVGGLMLEAVTDEATDEPTVVEVELPDSGPDAIRRISFYERHGFKAMNEFTYFQPPYAKGLPDVQLILMTTHPLPDPQSFVIMLHTLVYNQ